MSSFIGSRALPEITVHRPSGLQEALRLLEELPGESRLLAGGTDLVPAIRRGKWRFADGLNLIDLREVGELSYVEQEGDLLRIGAATRLSVILRSDGVRDRAPLLWEAVSELASLQIRNSATLGGNLCTASPAADTAPPLLALEASVSIRSARGETIVPLAGFFAGPGRTVLGKTDILTEVCFRPAGPQTRCRWLKLGRRAAFTLSVASAAVCLRDDGGKCAYARIALGAVAPTPMRARRAEEYLAGRRLDSETIEQAARMAAEEARPVSDVRAGAAYRREMVAVLTRRGLEHCSGG